MNLFYHYIFLLEQEGETSRKSTCVIEGLSRNYIMPFWDLVVSHSHGKTAEPWAAVPKSKSPNLDFQSAV